MAIDNATLSHLSSIKDRYGYVSINQAARLKLEDCFKSAGIESSDSKRSILFNLPGSQSLSHQKACKLQQSTLSRISQVIKVFQAIEDLSQKHAISIPTIISTPIYDNEMGGQTIAELLQKSDINSNVIIQLLK